MDAIDVRPGVRIAGDEVRFSSMRPGGPGGQHANTSATKVQLRFDVDGSSSLTPAQKARMRERLGSRITADGVLVLESGEHRSQRRNRDAVVARFVRLLSDALEPERPRRPTRRPRGADEQRLRGKRERSERKRQRRSPPPE